MKRLICIVLVFALAVTLIGCARQDGEQDGEEEFTCLYKTGHITVYRHNPTGVYYSSYYGRGITPMFNADGTPYTGG